MPQLYWCSDKYVSYKNKITGDMKIKLLRLSLSQKEYLSSNNLARHCLCSAVTSAVITCVELAIDIDIAHLYS